MTLLSGRTKKLLFAAVAVIGLAPAASAQTGGTAHADTASALRCLLKHERTGCIQNFVGSANRVAHPWLWWTPNQDFALGALVSSDYAGSETAARPYIAKFLNGRTADVYDVKFAHQEKTFYIVPPGPDGKVRYLVVRDGPPSDEARELCLHGPG
jgi:hypothetical protein